MAKRDFAKIQELLVELFCTGSSGVSKTSRERYKSAPYLRLKIAKGLQSVKYSFLQYPKNPEVGPNWRAKKGDSIVFFNTSVANIKRIEGDPLKTFRKKSQC